MSALSSVANQVMWNRLISVVEEQARALVRTAFSTNSGTGRSETGHAPYRTDVDAAAADARDILSHEIGSTLS